MKECIELLNQARVKLAMQAFRARGEAMFLGKTAWEKAKIKASQYERLRETCESVMTELGWEGDLSSGEEKT